MSTDRLAESQAELKSVLDERVAELKRVVADTEESTRHIIAAELEIDRSRRFRESLDEELGRVSQDVKALRARTEDLKSRQGERLTERDSLRDGVSELEIELTPSTSRLTSSARRAPAAAPILRAFAPRSTSSAAKMRRWSVRSSATRSSAPSSSTRCSRRPRSST